jgi:hypothetical protein
MSFLIFYSLGLAACRQARSSLPGDNGIKERSVTGETRATEGSGGNIEDVHLLDGSALMLWRWFLRVGDTGVFYAGTGRSEAGGSSSIKKGGKVIGENYTLRK